MLVASSAGSVHIESIENIQGIERSPSAVASAGTAAVAPPKFQIELREFGEGAVAVEARISSISASESPAR